MRIVVEHEAEAMLRKAGLPVAKAVLAKNEGQAVAAAKKLKYPVVLKLAAKKAVHKTELGAVKIAKNEPELRTHVITLQKLAKKKRMKLSGIYLQEFIRGEELILGLKKDATFGHVVLLGSGGILVELLKDVAFRVAPITPADAKSMIEELKGKALLRGFRGRAKVNEQAIIKTVTKLSQLPKRMPRISELDINPFIVNARDGKIVDARMVLD